MCFPKRFLDNWGCTNNWSEPSLSLCWTISVPVGAERALKMGQLGTTNGSKSGQNHGFQKNYPRPVVVPKKDEYSARGKALIHFVVPTSFVVEVS